MAWSATPRFPSPLSRGAARGHAPVPGWGTGRCHGRRPASQAASHRGPDGVLGADAGDHRPAGWLGRVGLSGTRGFRARDPLHAGERRGAAACGPPTCRARGRHPGHRRRRSERGAGAPAGDQSDPRCLHERDRSSGRGARQELCSAGRQRDGGGRPRCRVGAKAARDLPGTRSGTEACLVRV